MAAESQKWDRLSAKFNTHQDEVDPSAADNIVMAWPVVLDMMKKYGPTGGKDVLDFGCGTGGFCTALAKQGFSVTGLDFSPNMIAIAKSNASAGVDFRLGEPDAIAGLQKRFDAIVSIMVLQFVDDLPAVARTFSDNMKKNGIVVAAVVNPAFVQACLKKGVNFSDWNKEQKTAAIRLSDEFELTVFVRDAPAYSKAFEQAGLELLEIQTPSFPEGFAEKYGWTLPTSTAEFLILAFRKKA